MGLLSMMNADGEIMAFVIIGLESIVVLAHGAPVQVLAASHTDATTRTIRRRLVWMELEAGTDERTEYFFHGEFVRRYQHKGIYKKSGDE